MDFLHEVVSYSFLNILYADETAIKDYIKGRNVYELMKSIVKYSSEIYDAAVNMYEELNFPFDQSDLAYMSENELVENSNLYSYILGLLT